ncbi:MAG: amidohydrolase [Lachnospiraceae bacterium]|nr:amidohydrolase [Lachnospiraceae bacterium]
MGICIKNAHLLYDDRKTRKDVYIEGNTIAGIGRSPEGFRADTVIDASHKTLMPGLINAHTHVYMSLFRNFADDVPFQTWLFERILPIEDYLTAEQCYWGDMLNFAEMIRTGTTAFLDQQMFTSSCVKAAKDAGIRPVISRGLVGTVRTEEGVVRRWREAQESMEYAKELGSNATFMVAAHAIYTCSEDVLRFVLDAAKEKGLPITAHLSETKQEYNDCLKEHGCTPVQYFDRLGLLDHEITLAHCVWLADEDYKLLARPNVHVVTNPASNAKLANGFAPVARMLREGIDVALGTDGAASDNTQNMFTAMHLLSLMQKGVEQESVVLSAKETLKIATENGARAAGFGDCLGKIGEGKKADLILIDENAPNMLPNFDISSALVYSATGMEVTDSIIDGKLVMKDKELLTIDEERLRFEIAKITDKF